MDRWVLLIDKNQDQAKSLEKEWVNYGMKVHTVPDMPQGLEVMLTYKFVLAIIIGENGEYLPLLKLMRDLGPVPILVFSQEYNADEKVEALLRGADEYMEWPATEKERMASAQALVRRYTKLNYAEPDCVSTLTYKDLEITVESFRVQARGQEIKLTKYDFALLYLLVSHPGRVYTYEQLYFHVYQDCCFGNFIHAVRCQVSRLRSKLQTGPMSLDYIHTARGVGYYLE